MNIETDEEEDEGLENDESETESGWWKLSLQIQKGRPFLLARVAWL